MYYVPFLGCGKTLQENNGIFGFSPEPGQEYGERCEWRITATHGERIVLNITELDILKSDQCSTDYLEIRDGYWHKSPLLGKCILQPVVFFQVFNIFLYCIRVK